MSPLRFVIDTNVIVSGVLKPNGLERAALTFALTAPAVLFVSEEILAEYAEVLGRPELRIPDSERRSLLDVIADRSQTIVPERKLSICRDADDNMLLECAETAAADYLITGNKKHFPPYWHSTKIINARELLNIISLDLPLAD